MKFDETNGSQVEQLPIDIGDKEPLEAIKDLSTGKTRPMGVKESTSSTQVEASTSCQGEPQNDMEASTSGTRHDEEEEEVHHDDPPQPPSPPPQGDDTFNNEEDDDEEAPPSNKKKLSRV